MTLTDIKKLKLIMGKGTFINLFILYISLIFLSLIEIVGLGTIPLIVSAMINPGIINNFLGFDLTAIIQETFGVKNIILFLSFVIIAVFALKAIYLLIVNYYELFIIKKIKIKISQHLVKSYVLKPYIFFINRNSSNISKNILAEIDYSITYLRSIFQAVRELTLLISILILLFIIEPIIVISVFSIVLLFLAIFLLSVNKNLASIRKHRVAYLQGIFKVTHQLFAAIREVKVFKKENFFLDKFIFNKSRFEKQLLLAEYIKMLPRIFFEFIAIIIISSMIISFVFLQRDLNLLVPFMSLVAASIIRIIPSVSSLAASLTNVKVYKNSYDIIINETFSSFNKDILENKYKFKATRQNKRIGQNIVNVSNLKFTYADDKENKGYSIKNISFDIEKNSMVGVFGKSGAGKSTLINILLKLLDPEKGEVIYNFSNQNKNSDNLISFVPQDIYLLDDTVKNNVAFGIDEELIDEDRVVKCLKDAEIWNFVRKNPKGLNLLVGEKGIKLSGGEKQRLGLARALYFKPEILVLDEATNALDYKTENEIFKSIKKLRKKTTIIIISHKIALLDECDKIFYLDKGEIKDTGKMDSLKNKYPFGQIN